jgi:hypothetical protein
LVGLFVFVFFWGVGAGSCGGEDYDFKLLSLFLFLGFWGRVRLFLIFIWFFVRRWCCLLFWASEVFSFFLFGVSFFGGEVCGSAGVALVSFGFFSLCSVALQKSVAEEAEKREREKRSLKLFVVVSVHSVRVGVAGWSHDKATEKLQIWELNKKKKGKIQTGGQEV